jgi:hypothetical protein
MVKKFGEAGDAACGTEPTEEYTLGHGPQDLFLMFRKD